MSIVEKEKAAVKSITILPSLEIAYRAKMKKLGIKSLSEFMNRGALSMLSQKERKALPGLRSQGRPANPETEA